jgi:hypothetical protein
MPEDIDIRDDEVNTLLKAFTGFTDLLGSYPTYPRIRPEDLAKLEGFDTL